MSDERKKIGSIGEKLASDYLERIGYSILQRNFRCRYGEIDIIACNSDYLVFCEVKTRTAELNHQVYPHTEMNGGESWTASSFEVIPGVLESDTPCDAQTPIRDKDIPCPA